MKVQNSSKERLDFVFNLSWEIFLGRIINERIEINKESSMQLHLSNILSSVGELLCLEKGEHFSIELESNYQKKNIDITCTLGNTKAALELKCFRKKSNRATDTDMYDVLKDIERLLSYDDFQIRKFICLTDNKFYSTGSHDGHSNSVSIKNGKEYKKDQTIKPTWNWKNKSRDVEIKFKKDITLNWQEKKDWDYLILDL